MHEAIGADWEKDSNTAGRGIMGIWATFPCSLPEPSGPTQTITYIPPLFDDGVLHTSDLMAYWVT